MKTARPRSHLSGFSLPAFYILLLVLACMAFAPGSVLAADPPKVSIRTAEFDDENARLMVEVAASGRGKMTVSLFNDRTDELLAKERTRNTEIRFVVEGLTGAGIPCEVRVESGGLSDVSPVANAPSDCSGEPPPPPPPPAPMCSIESPVGMPMINVGDSLYFEGTATYPIGSVLSWEWNFAGGTDSVIPTVPIPGDVTFDHEGSFNVVMMVSDGTTPCEDNIVVEVGSPPVSLPPKVGEEPAPGTPGAGDGDHVVLAFNDLGMHCADLGSWPFSILPLFNVVNAQVIRRGSTPLILDDSSMSLQYSAASNPNDPVGPDSINSTSRNYPTDVPAGSAMVRKTDFWDEIKGQSIVSWFFGVDPPPDTGIFGSTMPGIAHPYEDNVPQGFSFYDPEFTWFTAFGMPITATDDLGRMNSYPLMRVQAVDNGTGNVVATTDAVVPVSTEVDCRDCHALGKVAADDLVWPDLDFVAPASNDRVDVEEAAKHNILVLHDYKHNTSFVAKQEPVLCATCHRSNALASVGGPAGIPSLNNMSNAMHGFHGRLQIDEMGDLMRLTGGEPDLIDPARMTGDEMQLIPTGPGVSMEESCFSCHPGKITQCFRGAMFTAGRKCDDCHGGMLAVGGEFDLQTTNQPREPWADEPKCSACHSGYGNDPVGTLAYDQFDPAATPIAVQSSRFAENPDTLYRNSLDNHAGVACEGCHGSPHAIWPNRNLNANDNVPALQLQGHAGTIMECSVCHTANSFPNGTLNGPHGMHPVNDPNWIKSRGDFYHEDFVWKNRQDQCAACHGADHRGTRLARVPVDRVMRDAEGVVRATLRKGEIVSCDLCHSLEKSFED